MAMWRRLESRFILLGLLFVYVEWVCLMKTYTKNVFSSIILVEAVIALILVLAVIQAHIDTYASGINVNTSITISSFNLSFTIINVTFADYINDTLNQVYYRAMNGYKFVIVKYTLRYLLESEQICIVYVHEHVRLITNVGNWYKLFNYLDYANNLMISTPTEDVIKNAVSVYPVEGLCAYYNLIPRMYDMVFMIPKNESPIALSLIPSGKNVYVVYLSSQNTITNTVTTTVVTTQTVTEKLTEIVPTTIVSKETETMTTTVTATQTRTETVSTTQVVLSTLTTTTTVKETEIQTETHTMTTMQVIPTTITLKEISTSVLTSVFTTTVKQIVTDWTTTAIVAIVLLILGFAIGYIIKRR